MKKREIGVCLFFAGSFIILFLNLWGRNLENHDYLRYAEVAKEMIQSGDWIVPRFNGEIFLHKPPFLFWLIALPSTIHGSVSPFLARLPSAFFAWLGAITVYLWGRKIWSGRRWGMVSAGILISSYLYFWQGRIARTDMVFSVLILLSLYFFHESYSVEDPSLSTLFSFLFMALAGLTKGPVGILFPLLIMFLFLLRRSQLKYFIRKDSIFGYFVAAVIPGVWVVLFLHQMGWEEALMAWQESEILSRQAPFYLYLTRVWVDFAPWSIFLPSLFYHYWRKEKRPEEEFLLLWFGGLFLLLTLFPVRASKYLLPTFPALALLMGGFWKEKRSFLLFGVLFAGALMAWHGHEFNLIQRNKIHRSGYLLLRDLKPHMDHEIYGYRIDMDVLARINFGGDRFIPRLKEGKEVSEKIERREKFFLITTEEGLYALRKQGIEARVVKEINHGKGSILLAGIQQDDEQR